MGKPSWVTWFTADPHFFHDNIMKFTGRPFKDMDDMLNKIREKWNKKVKSNDHVIIVGDAFFKFDKDKAKEYLSSLNGKKILVRGNHDIDTRICYFLGFDFVCEEMTLKIANETVTISHYPFKFGGFREFFRKLKYKILIFLKIKKDRGTDKFAARRPIDKGQFLIHGHTHSTDKVRGRSIHVGMDAWNYELVPIGEIGNIISKIRKKEGVEK
jgi:calcineurin-like phosphoesterase family protein